MIKQFQQFILENNLLKPADKILLAVSGGIDSIVMCELFYQSNINFVIAHCNFQLRGNESDADEKFVVSLAKKYGLEYFSKKFETEKYAQAHKLSIQMAARDLRYSWFEEIRKQNNFKSIAVAHNKNDVAETILLNLSRGTGIAGLHGISAKNKNVIRPLLFASKEEIENFQKANKLKYREDSSNKSDEYNRNFIRHKIIPVFQKLNPSFVSSIYESSKHISEAENFIKENVNIIKSKISFSKSNEFFIDIEKLNKQKNKNFILFYLLTEYDFNKDVTDDILAALKSQSGKIFYSESHQLVRDRKYLIVSKKKENKVEAVSVFENTEKVEIPVKIQFSKLKVDKLKINANSENAYLDFDKLKFPLEIRKWKNGDKFIPFGMSSKKKISDFLIDKKVPLTEKQNTFALVSGSDIVCLIGHRIDDRYKVSPQTKTVLTCVLQK